MFQDFVDELRGKEEELSKVSKMADNFRDGSHVCSSSLLNKIFQNWKKLNLKAHGIVGSISIKNIKILKFHVKRIFCDGQGADRRAFLCADRSCCLLFFGTLRINFCLTRD